MRYSLTVFWRPRPSGKVIALRAVSGDGEAYRRTSDVQHELPPVRPAEARPLTEVITALAPLSPRWRPGRKRFEVMGLEIRVADPRAVDPAKMIVEGRQTENA